MSFVFLRVLCDTKQFYIDCSLQTFYMQDNPESRRRFIYKISASFGSMVFASHGLTTFASCNDKTTPKQNEANMKNKDGKS